FTEPKSADANLKAWSQGADPVLGWAEDRVLKNPQTLTVVNSETPKTPTSKAYIDFRGWYLEEGLGSKPPGRKTFVTRLKVIGPEYGFKYEKANSERNFVGMMLKPLSPGLAAAIQKAERLMQGF